MNIGRLPSGWLLLFLAITLWVHGQYGRSIMGRSQLDEDADRLERGLGIFIFVALVGWVAGRRWLQWW